MRRPNRLNAEVLRRDLCQLVHKPVDLRSLIIQV